MSNVASEDENFGSIISDFLKSLYEIRFSAPLIALFGVIVSYHLTIAPYRSSKPIQDSYLNFDLSLVRPVLSNDEKHRIHFLTLRAETKFEYFPPLNSSFKIKFQPSIGKQGSHPPPDFFYEGVVFGLSVGNSHNIKYSEGQRFSKNAMITDLELLSPGPSTIFHRTASCNNTDWYDEGLAVYYSYADLRQHGKVSSDNLKPWKRMNEDILWVARKFRQVYVTVWYPHRFGNTNQDDQKSLVNIIQSIIPTRTGLDEIKSDSVVWMTEVNDLAPQSSNLRFYRQPPASG